MLNVFIKEGRGWEKGGPPSIDDCADKTIQEIEEYPKRAKNDWLQQPVTTIATEGQRVKQQNLENKSWKKTTVWILQATNWGHCTRYDQDIAKKRKP